MNVVELAQSLVRIPSVNPAGTPGVAQPGEEACARAVADVLRQSGAEVHLQDVQPGRPNVVGRFPSDRPGKKRLVFAPHLDTVSVVGMSIDPFGAELRDGRLWGRGACDTKGPMAAMLCALGEMGGQIATLPFEIWFAALMGEESGQYGAKAFVAEHKMDFAVVGEPTDLQIVHTHKGSMWLKIVVRGKAAHSSSPHLGENAIYTMTGVVQLLRDVIAPELAKLRDPVLGAPTINVGTITGGTKTNIVPDFCQVELDVRTIPGHDFSWIRQRLEERFAGIEIQVWESRPLFTDPDHPLITALQKLGAGCVGAPWFCDAAIFAQAGVPAVAIGPGSIAQAHTKDEWISIQALQSGVEFYKRFMQSL